MSSTEFTVHTSLSPREVLAVITDFGPDRARWWPNVDDAHFAVHDQGPDWAEVTEGNPWPVGLVWERLRYDWAQPGLVKGVVIDSNIFKPGSTWEIRATPYEDGSLVEVIGVRILRGLRGRMLAPFFPLGLARREVAAHLRHFLSRVEAAG